jgi:hypothetical protein
MDISDSTKGNGSPKERTADPEIVRRLLMIFLGARDRLAVLRFVLAAQDVPTPEPAVLKARTVWHSDIERLQSLEGTLESILDRLLREFDGAVQ